MTAIVLGWNPDQRDWEPNYASAIDSIRESGVFRSRWPAPAGADIAVGTDAWLVLQGTRERGLIGHGVVSSGLAANTPGQDDDGAPVSAGSSVDGDSSVRVDFDLLLPRGEPVPEAALLKRVPGIAWDTAPKSGTRLAPADERLLRILWAEHVPPSDIDPIVPRPGVLPGSALTRVAANRYEQNPQARRECIAHHGSSCAACGFSFEATYGGIGGGFISVHHIVPASRLGEGYELDPLTDLVPLCPNCHAMSHRRTPDPYTPAELRQIIRRSRHLDGVVVSPDELHAQADARRILGEN